MGMNGVRLDDLKERNMEKSFKNFAKTIVNKIDKSGRTYECINRTSRPLCKVLGNRSFLIGKLDKNENYLFSTY
jgi:hypothetical protein